MAYKSQKGKVGVCPDEMYDENVGVEAQGDDDQSDDEERPTHRDQDSAGA